MNALSLKGFDGIRLGAADRAGLDQRADLISREAVFEEHLGGVFGQARYDGPFAAGQSG